MDTGHDLVERRQCGFGKLRAPVEGESGMLFLQNRIAVVLALVAVSWVSDGFNQTAHAQIRATPPVPRGEHMEKIAKFEAWLGEFKTAAVAKAIDPHLASQALSEISFNERVLELEAFQPEFVRPIWEYLDSAASDLRIANGWLKAQQNAALLEALESRYGVAAEVLLAIWGVETAYGEQLGSFNVIEALAAVAFAGRRSEFAEGELLAALDILAEVEPEAFRLQGSWAGAMGHTQFIPSTFLAHAVDYDGDGRRNVWSEDPSDALASAANYLAASGWRADEPAAIEVRLPDDFDYRLAEVDHARPYREWRESGLVLASGDPLPDGPPEEAAAYVITPTGATGPAFLAFGNFQALLTYNNATSYALAVWTLAEQIAGRASIQGDWPEGEDAIRVEDIREFQVLLTDLGHDTGEIDGLVGPNTRAAVRAFQEALQLVPDGYVTPALIEEARRRAAANQGGS